MEDRRGPYRVGRVDTLESNIECHLGISWGVKEMKYALTTIMLSLELTRGVQAIAELPDGSLLVL